jgi:hypothetical protein
MQGCLKYDEEMKKKKKNLTYLRNFLTLQLARCRVGGEAHNLKMEDMLLFCMVWAKARLREQ